MDKEQTLDLLHAATDATAGLGFGWTVTLGPKETGTRQDAQLLLRYAGLQFEFEAEAKTNLRPAMLGAVQKQLTAYRGNPLLVADYITPQIAEDLRRRGLQFIDTAGNAYINQPPMLVWITGQKQPVPVATDEPRNRAFQPTGLKVLFALLCRPDAVNLPYREIAEMAGVAHGTVGWVMPELPKLGFMVDVDNRRRLIDRERLLGRWVETYARLLRPKLLLARYQAPDLNQLMQVAPEKYEVLLGGEPAAYKLAGTLRPGVASLYVDNVDTKLVAEFRLRPDPKGNVELRKRFWNFQPPDKGLVPAILVYADLLATGDPRCFEAAQELYGGIVDRLKR